ncbi:hypothetical protein FIBSPDRAFT_925281 [Athelia psychrophila]|uniref:Uncharacterized protein n=1 Tax=Athelia psychrophila TaxID=1759441 RepID=A0A166V4J0_9AGAM|nr:hypothetical protein FIBSPDRAFT_925281 [Fibularhizoctonia sp. CBS 109695]
MVTNAKCVRRSPIGIGTSRLLGDRTGGYPYHVEIMGLAADSDPWRRDQETTVSLNPADIRQMILATDYGCCHWRACDGHEWRWWLCGVAVGLSVMGGKGTHYLFASHTSRPYGCNSGRTLSEHRTPSSVSHGYVVEPAQMYRRGHTEEAEVYKGGENGMGNVASFSLHSSSGGGSSLI